MSDEEIVNTVRSKTTDTPGRSLNSAGQTQLVIDEPEHAGGPHEALTPADAFLSGVASCGVLLVETFARQRDVPLDRAEANIQAYRDAEDTSWFKRIDLVFDIEGPTEEQARQLVDSFREK